MKHCHRILGLVALLALVTGVAGATEYTNFSDWARDQGITPQGDAGLRAFGDVVGSFPSGNISTIGIGYDPAENGIWVANESGGSIYLINAAAPHNVIRSINILALGITTDGNQDGVAVVGNVLYVTDFQGDLNLADDCIYGIDRVTGTLIDIWYVDGAQNPNPNAFMNTVLGIAPDGAGGFWVTTNDSQLHNVTLMPGGNWVRNAVQAVPGGGSWAGIDLDTCLNEYFAANFANNQFHYIPTMPLPPAMSAPSAGPNVTGITSNNNGTIWTVGFGDNVIYEHEGIGCSVPVEASSWGAIKGIYR